jgi:hypothetical protein
MDKLINYIKLRPHHVLCSRFFSIEPPDRGEAFERIYREILAKLISDEETIIEVIQGSDDLCEHCSYFETNRCISPFGDEEKVRRWDSRVMEGLCLNYGDRMTSGEFKKLINQKTPFEFCKNRCPWKSICTVFT